ncbi:MAG: DUF484 family protein [Shimia sp.]
MSTQLRTLDVDVRDRILESPEDIIADPEVMAALITAHERNAGANIVDLRSVAMARTEERLGRLEETHRLVIAAAYENLAGTNQIHRAILRMMDPTDFPSFLRDLTGEVADILRVDVIRLVLETDAEGQTPPLQDVVTLGAPGFVESYLDLTRGGAERMVVLRQVHPKADAIYGERLDWINSEACIKLDFGEGRLPGMLVMGSEDPHQFSAAQGTDLLAFFGGVFERAMRRWLQ